MTENLDTEHANSSLGAARTEVIAAPAIGTQELRSNCEDSPQKMTSVTIRTPCKNQRTLRSARKGRRQSKQQVLAIMSRSPPGRPHPIVECLLGVPPLLQSQLSANTDLGKFWVR